MIIIVHYWKDWHLFVLFNKNHFLDWNYVNRNSSYSLRMVKLFGSSSRMKTSNWNFKFQIKKKHNSLNFSFLLNLNRNHISIQSWKYSKVKNEVGPLIQFIVTSLERFHFILMLKYLLNLRTKNRGCWETTSNSIK